MSDTYEAKVVHDSNGDTILEFPDEVMEQLGWEIGDDLEFNQDEQGNITITKIVK